MISANGDAISLVWLCFDCDLDMLFVSKSSEDIKLCLKLTSFEFLFV